MEIDLRAFDSAGSIKNHSERSFCRDVWIEVLERTCGRVSRISEQRQSRGFAFPVQFLEACLIEISFSANFENLWRRPAQLVRHRFDRLNILSDVVADKTIAASRSVFQFAAFVHHRNRDPIDFWLDNDRD